MMPCGIRSVAATASVASATKGRRAMRKERRAGVGGGVVASGVQRTPSQKRHSILLHSMTRLTQGVPWLCDPASRRVCHFVDQARPAGCRHRGPDARQSVRSPVRRCSAKRLWRPARSCTSCPPECDPLRLGGASSRGRQAAARWSTKRVSHTDDSRPGGIQGGDSQRGQDGWAGRCQGRAVARRRRGAKGPISGRSCGGVAARRQRTPHALPSAYQEPMTLERHKVTVRANSGTFREAGDAIAATRRIGQWAFGASAHRGPPLGLAMGVLPGYRWGPP